MVNDEIIFQIVFYIIILPLIVASSAGILFILITLIKLIYSVFHNSNSKYINKSQGNN